MAYKVLDNAKKEEEPTAPNQKEVISENNVEEESVVIDIKDIKA